MVSISGLNNVNAFKPQYGKTNRPTQPLAHPPGLTPAQIKTAYDLDKLYAAGLTAKDQDIAIASYMDFSIDDVREYYSFYKITPLPTVDAVSFDGNATYDADSAKEAELEAELSGMIAPGAKIHVFTSAQNSESGELAMFTAILDDNRAKVVSYGWGICESNLSSTHRANMDRIFARAIAQGVNIFVASGDTGSHACGDHSLTASWPATHPNVIAVGSTLLGVDENAKRVDEIGSTISGGGLSAFYPLPAWQSEFKAPFIRRSYPDVAFNGDPSTGQGIWIRSTENGQAQWELGQGTGASAAQWAGFMALVNQARFEKGLGSVGFISPMLYNASPIEKVSMFNDIRGGNNGGYSAGQGWDAVTGWGSMKGSAMVRFFLGSKQH